jgi:hypothetical protein
MPGRGAAGRAEHTKALEAAQRLLTERYPQLRFEIASDGTATAQGSIEFELPDGTGEAIEVRISFGRRYPVVPPIAYDAAERWEPDPDRHILSDHSFCLYFGGVEAPNLRTPGAFAVWMIDLVLFLHQQLVCDAIEGRRFPGPDWPHGERPAYAQHLVETLQTFPADKRSEAWRAVQLGHLGRNWPCPCGSGRKLKRCHGDALNELARAARRAGLETASYDDLEENARAA